MNAPLTREVALEQLAQVLFLAMERFDPSEDGDEWTELTESQKEIYRASIREVLLRPRLVVAAMS